METCADDAKETTILQVVSALSLALVGVLGTVLNILVILGVLGNARLGTTVNKLLIWICTFALLEATLGITMKALILGKRKGKSLFNFCNRIHAHVRVRVRGERMSKLQINMNSGRKKNVSRSNLFEFLPFSIALLTDLSNTRFRVLEWLIYTLMVKLLHMQRDLGWSVKKKGPQKERSFFISGSCQKELDLCRRRDAAQRDLGAQRDGVQALPSHAFYLFQRIHGDVDHGVGLSTLLGCVLRF